MIMNVRAMDINQRGYIFVIYQKSNLMPVCCFQDEDYCIRYFVDNFDDNNYDWIAVNLKGELEYLL